MEDNPIKIDSKPERIRISSYLFAPPPDDSTNISPELTSHRSKIVISPPTDLLLPDKSSESFRNSTSIPIRNHSRTTFPQAIQDKIHSEKLSTIGKPNISGRIVAPAEKYGEPGIVSVDTPQNFDSGTDIVLGNPDCDRNGIPNSVQNRDPLQGYPGTNQIYPQSPEVGYDPNRGLTNANYPNGNYNPGVTYPSGSYNPGLSSSGGTYNPGVNYPNGNYNPNLNYPNSNYNPNVNYPNGNYNPSIDYPNGNYNPSLGYPNGNNNPNVNYPNGNYPESFNPLGNYPNSYSPNYPNGNYNPSSGFYPSTGYPGYIPGTNNGWSGSGTIGRFSECCGFQNTNRRFLITSPGFPSAAYSANAYECGYTIRRSSQDICRLRLNLKFFNYGSEDQFCTYGHLEIDGRRYCGCKTGQSIVVPFSDYVAKTLTVRYVGYPKTKLNGFLIDVIQESCGYNGRSDPTIISNRNDGGDSKKEFNSTQSSRQGFGARNNSTISRPKRDLGYLYQKPNFAFPIQQVKGITKEKIFLNTCQSRAFLDWVISAKEAYFSNARCGGFGNFGGKSPTSSGRYYPYGCNGFNGVQGNGGLPRYPYNYPTYARGCYR